MFLCVAVFVTLISSKYLTHVVSSLDISVFVFNGTACGVNLIPYVIGYLQH